ncbi:MAG: META domain-containing protein [Anaerolineae bacterium]|nr:META domain-containing protein [Anaerolineae bacterium]
MKKIIIAVCMALLLVRFTPPTLQAQTAVQCEEEYQVQVGDTLASIAEETLNDPLAFPVLVVLANAVLDDDYTNIDDPNVIEEGWTLCIPSEEDVPELLAEADPAIQAVARQAGLTVPPSLEETLWVLVGYGSPDEVTLVQPGAVVTAQFGADGSLTGSAGCNTYNTSFEFGRNDNLTIQPATTTFILCEEFADLEQFYLGALEQATGYQITPEGFLEIEYSTGRLSSQSLFFVAGQANLKNTQWVLQRYGDPEALQAVEPATTITAVFTGPADSNEGTLIGFGGCNRYTTGFTIEADQISIDPMAATMMACEVGGEQEAAYQALLQEAETFQITGKQLQLTGPNGVLIYSSINLPLEQVLWTLESFGDPAGQQPVSTETDITALFTPTDEATADEEADDEETDEEAVDEDEAVEVDSVGIVSGSTGCNRYSAGYSKTGRQLSLEPAITTLMACETGQEAEQAFLAALESIERYQVLGDQLRVFYEDGLQVLTFRADRTPLQDTFWALTSYGPIEAPQFPLADAAVTAIFDRQPATPTGMVAGSTGCNSYSATFAASVTQLKINPPINTLIFCGGVVGDTERAFLQGLASAEGYTIIGDTLQIMYDDGEQALNFVASQPPVEIPAPTAVIEGPTEAQVGDTVTFSSVASQSETTIVQHSWDFGDGVTASGPAVNHIYSRAGDFTVRLTIVDDRGVSSSTTSRITITDPPAQGPTAVIEGPTHALVDQEVTFRGGNSVAGNSSIVSYAWSINQVQPFSGGADVRFSTSFDEPGRYEVSLTVTDQNGLSDSASLSIDIFPREEPQTPPTAVIEGPTQATTGQEVTFRGGNSIPGSTPIVVYAWSVDGVQPFSGGADVRFSTTFDEPGQYEVSLTVSDQNGLSDTSSIVVTVEEEPSAEGPTAVIEGPSQALVGDDVTFQGGNSIAGSTPIVVYAWSVDGAQTFSGGTDVRFSTSFDQPGSYNVTLTVTDQNDLSDTSSLRVEVTQPDEPQTPPSVGLDGPSQAAVGENVTFQARGEPGSSPISGYAWDFGNGQTASGESASTVYDAPGTYQVSVTVTDENGLSSSATRSISIQASLAGTSWVLSNSLPDTRLTVEFGNGTISGSSGCNTFNGSFSTSGSNSISVGQLSTTQAACEEEVMEQEQDYVAALSSAQSYTIAGNTLTITHPGGTLTFQEQ